MTSTPDLNIAGSPIYESLVATSGDPYQPPAYQLPDVYGSRSEVAAYGDGSGGGAGAGGSGWGWGGQPDWSGSGGPGWNGGMPPNAGPAMLSQFLGRMLGDGQSWVAVMIFGGPIADQLRQQQFMQQFGQNPQYGPPGASGYGNVPGYGFGGGFGYGVDNVPGAGMDGAMAQAYQQAYQWAAQQQAALAAAQVQAALPALPAAPDPVGVPYADTPPELPPAEATQVYSGMLNQDWAGWLGQTAQGARVSEQEDDRPPPYEDERGGGLSSRLGAAMRELRGR